MSSNKPFLNHPYMNKHEQVLSQQFIDQGYVIVGAEDKQCLKSLQALVVKLACTYLDEALPEDNSWFLNNIHQHVSVDQLNELRLAVIQGINANADSRAIYLSLVQNAVNTLVGNELAMQRRINLSIQVPNDDSSLLPIHSDVWDGDSPFEVVIWIPLVDCYNTKSMYIVDPETGNHIRDQFSHFKNSNAENLYQKVANKAHFLNIPFGHILLFSQTMMHGNRINIEKETRWSMNLRVKSLLSPYDDKRLGEFFEPISMRAATRIGLEYRYYDGFDDE